jgi:hypothetical protein
LTAHRPLWGSTTAECPARHTLGREHRYDTADRRRDSGAGWLPGQADRGRRDKNRCRHERELAREARQQDRLEHAYLELGTCLARHEDWARSVRPFWGQPPHLTRCRRGSGGVFRLWSPATAARRSSGCWGHGPRRPARSRTRTRRGAWLTGPVAPPPGWSRRTGKSAWRWKITGRRCPRPPGDVGARRNAELTRRAAPGRRDGLRQRRPQSSHRPGRTGAVTPSPGMSTRAPPGKRTHNRHVSQSASRGPGFAAG